MSNESYITGPEDYALYRMKMEREMEEQMYMEKQKRKDKLTESVIEDLRARAARGIEKYNTTLEQNNHQNMLQHGYEEALDLAQYLKKEITTLNTVQDLVKQYPNDAELGEQIRLRYRHYK